MLTYTIDGTDHCRRVESFLQNLLPDAPLSYLKKLVKGGHVAGNGAPVLADDLLHLGDRVTLKESGRTRTLIVAARPALDILYEDDRIVVVNKPPGLAVHRSAEAGDENLVELAERFMEKRGTPVKLRP